MPVTALHKPSGQYLTSFYLESKRGDRYTLSVPSTSKKQPSRWCEFTTYILSDPVAYNGYGYPLFKLADCQALCPLDDR